MDPIHHGMSKVPSSIKLMSIHKDKWFGYIVMPIHNVYSLPRVMLQCLHQDIYMIPNNIGYNHIHGAREYRMRLYFYLFLWKTRHDLKHWYKEQNRIYLTNYTQDKALIYRTRNVYKNFISSPVSISYRDITYASTLAPHVPTLKQAS